MLSPGAKVDRYVLIAPVGEGGQGSVWKARDPLSEKAIRAIKFVDVRNAGTKQLERIRREARALSRVEHQSIVRCHALFEDLEFEVLGLVLDYVDGVCLADALDDPRLTAQHRGDVLVHLAHALAYLHRRGVVHRDLKPDNVILTREFWQDSADPRNTVLVDFGIAAVPEARTRLTDVGRVIGTPPYMAPEVVAGQGGAATKPSCDVFAFGVLAWEVLAGTHPSGIGFGRSLFEYGTAYRQLRAAGSASVATGTAPQGWAPLLAKCLALDPSARAADGDAIVALLHSLVGRSSVRIAPTKTDEGISYGLHSARGKTELATPSPDLFRPSYPARRKDRRSAVLVALAALLVAAAAFVAVLVTLEEPALTALVPEIEGIKLDPKALPPGCTSRKLCDCCPNTPEFPNRCCSSGTSCRGPCADAADATERFHIRLANAWVVPTPDSPTELHSVWPNGRVCFGVTGVSGSWECTPASQAPALGVSAPFVTATAGLLADPGLILIVTDGQNQLVRADRYQVKGFSRNVFCHGMRLKNLRTDHGSEIWLDFYFDPPDEREIQRCVGTK